MDDSWEKDINRKVVNKKPPNPEEVLGGKPISYNWRLKRIRELTQVWDWNLKNRSFDEIVS